MDPVTMAALISGGSSLLGGMLGGGTTERSAGYNFKSHVKGVMQASERYGINPLTLLNVAPIGPSSFQSANYMGSAIADAGMAVANGISEKAKLDELKRQNELEEQNKKLQEKVQQLTIRPKVGGIYAGNVATPSLAAAVPSASQEPPKVTNTYQTYQNDGQSTDVPMGPDIDEVVSGSVIAATNSAKAQGGGKVMPRFGDALAQAWEFWDVMRNPKTETERKRERAQKKFGPVLNDGTLGMGMAGFGFQ